MQSSVCRHTVATMLCLVVILLSTGVQGKQLVVGVAGQSHVPLVEQINERLAGRPDLRATELKVITVPPAPAELMGYLATDPAVDVLLVSYQTARSLFDAGLVWSLDDVARRQVNLGEALATVPQGVRSTAVWHGQWIGVPLFATLRLIGLNTSHADDAGLDVSPHWTWDEFALAGQRLNTLRPASAVLCALPDCWLPFVWSHGGGYVDDTVDVLQLTWPASESAFASLQQWVQDGSVSLRPGFFGAGLGSGVLSMAPADSTELWTIAPGSAAQTTVAHVPFPRSPATNESVTIVNSSLYVVNRGTELTPQVIAFLSTVLDPVVQDAVVQAGYFASTAQVQRVPTTTALSSAVLQQALARSRALPVPAKGDILTWPPVADQITDLLTGRISYETFVRQIAAGLELE